MTDAVTAAFAAQGFEIVTAPGPGVLRIAPSRWTCSSMPRIRVTPTIQGQIARHEAGTATLILETRDAVTGTLVGRVVDRESAQEVQRFSRATSVSNTFWFDAMFRQWAANCAEECKAAP